MINWSDIKLLQKQKQHLQLKLEELLSLNKKEEIIRLKTEIQKLDKTIDNLLKSSDIEFNKAGANTKGFYELKDKLKKINKLKTAISKMIQTVELYFNNEEIVNESKKTK